MILTAPLSANHHLAQTPDGLQRMVAAMRGARERGVDFETDGLRWFQGDRPFSAALGFLDRTGQAHCFYTSWGHRTPEVRADPEKAKAAIRDALTGADAIINHNLKFDLHMSRMWGGADGPVIPDGIPLHDTMVQAFLVYEERRLGLEALVQNEGLSPWGDAFEAKNLVGDTITKLVKTRRMKKTEYLAKYGHTEVPVSIEAEYACRDVAHSLILDREQRANAMGEGMGRYEANRLSLYQNEMLLVRALTAMEAEGQLCNSDYLRQCAWWLDEDLERRRKELTRIFRASIDWGNDNALRDFLFNRLRLTVTRKTEKGDPSVGTSALQDHVAAMPQLADLIEFRVRLKVRRTYTIGIANLIGDDGRLHPNFRQTGARTGRLSCTDPNFQNFPARHKEMARMIRQAFYVEQGMARLYSDYSQVELRFLGWATGCVNLIEAYESAAYYAYLRGALDWKGYQRARAKETAADVHSSMCKKVFGVVKGDPGHKPKRNATKAINFGVPYGGGTQMLTSNPLLRLGMSEAESLLAEYHMKNPEIKSTKATLFKQMLSKHGTPHFTNWAGRTRHGPRLRHRNRDANAEEERAMFASLVQGSAGELTRFSIVRLWRMAESGEIPAVSSSTVHDEIQLDCHASDVADIAPKVRFAMEDFHHFGGTPIVTDLEVTYTNWADKKDYEIHE